MKTPSAHGVLDAISRTDFQSFAERAFNTLHPTEAYLENWSHEVIAHYLDRCAKREIKRLLILLPPRSLKSFMVSVAFPAYLLGQDPSLKIIAVSYGDALATELSNNTRAIIKSHWYGGVFPHTRISNSKDTQTEFKTTEHGGRFATTVGGPLTGLGGDVIIIDDPQKASEVYSESVRKSVNSWFDSTVLSRLDEPKRGVIIVVMQRLHVDDLAGHLLEQQGWTVLKIPARAEIDRTYELGDGKTHTFKAGELLHPERLGQAELDERRSAMGTAAFYAQYQQEPIPPAGNIFKWEWFKHVDVIPEFSEVIMSVDVAASPAGNYSAFTVWGHRDANWCLIAVYRNKMELPDVRRRLIRLDEKHRPDLILIDGVGVGRGLWAELRDQGFKHLFGGKGDGKLVGAHAILPIIEGGRVSILTNCPGITEFRDEVIAFPDGKYNDQVDSMVQLFKYENRALELAHRYKRAERKHIPTSAPKVEIKVTMISAGPRRLVAY